MAPQFEVPEGATPLEEVSGLLPDGIYTYADLCAAEAENILLACDKHLGRRKRPTRAWFTEEYVRRVHRDMFGAVWKWAGKYRDSWCNLGGPAERIHEEIQKLCGDVRYWDSDANVPMTIVERAVRIHHRLAWIHPFMNGNGRHARLMADIYLHAHHHSLPMWPSSDLSQAGEVRTCYLEALHLADEGDFAPLMAYTAQYVSRR